MFYKVAFEVLNLFAVQVALLYPAYFISCWFIPDLYDEKGKQLTLEYIVFSLFAHVSSFLTTGFKGKSNTTSRLLIRYMVLMHSFYFNNNFSKRSKRKGKNNRFRTAKATFS